MNKPELSDYGLRGIDSRPRADFNNHPMSDDERLAAYEALIAYQVETHRVVAFRAALSDYDWEQHEANQKGVG